MEGGYADRGGEMFTRTAMDCVAEDLSGAG